MKARSIALLGMLALLAGCGGRAALRPQEGASLPPTPYAAREAPTAEELMTPGPQARPQRSDELLRRSEEREDDRFDLPPTA
ncbi:hypothetical protein GGR88_002491 [Sphingomonas jejuensis]|jgi:hypothetical protein|uniref:Argininosuccinate lyase n=1 Tax=Sphingomonas jejuensis TaxID=904715 RepID=A0ABX0XNM2_9SPHN|nr:hypothetical protein [Sphingomonas jejuensis]NJC34977.1 hypothetical protein [Sphingomonas jejuensis]